jgi:hypothetical protein
MKKVLRRRPSGAMIVAIVALVVALSGTAVAAGKLGLGAFSKKAKNKTVGVGKLTYMSTTTTIPPYPPGDTPVSAQCPAGTHVIGGGIKLPEPPGDGTAEEYIDDSHPTATGWAGRVSNFDNSSATATTTAICAVSRVVAGAPPAS